MKTKPSTYQFSLKSQYRHVSRLLNYTGYNGTGLTSQLHVSNSLWIYEYALEYHTRRNEYATSTAKAFRVKSEWSPLSHRTKGHSQVFSPIPSLNVTHEGASLSRHTTVRSPVFRSNTNYYYPIWRDRNPVLFQLEDSRMMYMRGGSNITKWYPSLMYEREWKVTGKAEAYVCFTRLVFVTGTMEQWTSLLLDEVS